MMETKKRASHLLLVLGLIGLIGLISLLGLAAGCSKPATDTAAEQAPAPPVQAPHPTEGSPEIYSLAAENDRVRVVHVNFQPGQRDAWHSHPPYISYILTDGLVRMHATDGSTEEITAAAGQAIVHPPQSSHSVENLSDSELRAVLFERLGVGEATPMPENSSPPATEAAPDVYSVIGENEHMRLILATWQPGQRDTWHSHPTFATYFLTDVQGRLHFPDGRTEEITGAAGRAAARPAEGSHSFENLSSSECRILIAEAK